MMNDLTIVSAFLVGLFGSVHCIGMCGGIVGALTMGLSEEIRQSYWRLIPYLITYNLGRITSYTVAGLLVGFLGAQFAQVLPMDNPRMIAMWVSGIFMIALGLYIGGWWQFLVWLEKAGSYLWRKIEPLGKKLLPISNPFQALGLGLVWGWLPCGLVYSVLAFSLVSGDTIQGGLLMLAFGIGTLPMLFAIGTAANWLVRITRHVAVQRTIGALIIVFGLFTIFGPHHHKMKNNHHHEHSPQSQTIEHS